MKYAGLDLGTIEAIVNKLGGLDGAMAFLRGETVVKMVEQKTFSVSVNYALSVEEMVQRGKYDWANNDITQKNFPHDAERGTEEVAVELIHFNRVMTSVGALAELDQMGMRPITLPELLAFGEKCPDVQREFPVVALGSVWRHPSGGRCVPCLGRYGSERGLDLRWVGRGWDGFCRFAAVRK